LSESREKRKREDENRALDSCLENQTFAQAASPGTQVLPMELIDFVSNYNEAETCQWQTTPHFEPRGFEVIFHRTINQCLQNLYSNSPPPHLLSPLQMAEASLCTKSLGEADDALLDASLKILAQRALLVNGLQHIRLIAPQM
jgi:hypothetical protein